MKNRVYNFAAGPSMLADEVLSELHEEFFNYHDSGMAVVPRATLRSLKMPRQD